MALSVRPQHLKRYKDIALLLVKYGRSDLANGIGVEQEFGNRSAHVTPPAAEELAADLERMGPTFIKLGQLLSTRPDFLPRPYLEALARLQDKVEPFSFEEVEAIIPVEIGARISRAFSHFDPHPIAAASLGQVHRAALRDGRPVAVKVQRPNIRAQVVDDLEAIEEIAGALEKHTEFARRYEMRSFVEEFRKSLLRELDYRQEATNLRVLSENLKEFDRIVVPLPIDDYTTSRVLTMEYIAGTKITSLSPLVRLEYDGKALAEQIFRAYLQQILVHGFFHADPHPGNVFLTEDHRVALIDLGMIARIAPRTRELLLQLLLAISDGRSDDAADTAIKLGEAKNGFDEQSFRRRIAELVGHHQNLSLEKISVGAVVLDVTSASAEANMRVPPDLAMLGKTLLNLDAVGRTLDPQFDPNAAVRRNAGEILQRHLLQSMAPGNLFSGVLEMKDLIARLPARLNRLLDAITHNEMRMKIDAIDTELLMSGFQKVANRITLGLILAALIVGAAMLMRVETDFRIAGYPGFAIICFVLAAAGGIAFALHILKHDIPSRKK
jgi:ubiquinone biosynthesis protein